MVVDPATMHEGSLALKLDPAEVFRRALWRRPAPDDRILHAERREWTVNPADGIAHWQWFLEVEPGAALESWLRTQNPFSVQSVADAAAVSKPEGAPAWFPADFSGYEIHTGGVQGRLMFLFSRQGGRFFATSSGTGLTPAARAPDLKPAASSGPAMQDGRLPLSSPVPPITPSNQ